MTRIITAQPGSSVPKPILIPAITVEWMTLLEAPDFSLPDTQLRWPGVENRDPANNLRRIRPGFALIESPLMFNNSGTVSRWVEIRILSEMEVPVLQARYTVPGGETYPHPAPGQRLLKRTLASLNGDRLQVRAEVAGVISVTAAASEGAADQHQPAGS
jgi:hypothetical protein